jgi:glycosyltransferase involved in cell wall biosynthesis
MRILILAESFYPLGGGVGTYGLALSRELVRRGVGVTVVTRRQRSSLERREIIDGVEIVRLAPSGFPRSGKYLTLPPVLNYLRRHRGEYDLIYVWGLRILGVAAALAGRYLGKPVVLRAEQTGEISGSFAWQDRRTRPGVGDRLVRSALRARDRLLRRAGGAPTPCRRSPRRCALPAAGTRCERCRSTLRRAACTDPPPREDSRLQPPRVHVARAPPGHPSDVASV